MYNPKDTNPGRHRIPSLFPQSATSLVPGPHFPTRHLPTPSPNPHFPGPDRRSQPQATSFAAPRGLVPLGDAAPRHQQRRRLARQQLAHLQPRRGSEGRQGEAAGVGAGCDSALTTTTPGTTAAASALTITHPNTPTPSRRLLQRHHSRYPGPSEEPTWITQLVEVSKKDLLQSCYF